MQLPVTQKSLPVLQKLLYNYQYSIFKGNLLPQFFLYHCPTSHGQNIAPKRVVSFFFFFFLDLRCVMGYRSQQSSFNVIGTPGKAALKSDTYLIPKKCIIEFQNIHGRKCCFVLIEMQSLYPDQFVALRSFVLAIWEKAAECHNLKK